MDDFAAKTEGAGALRGVRPARQRRSRETQDKIVTAALAVFADRGFEGASTHEIAEVAGINQPLILYHFGSKERLWQAAAERILDRFLDGWRQRVEWLEGLGSAARLKIMLADFVTFTTEHPELFQFLIEANKRGDFQLSALVESRLRPYFEFICGEIKEAQSAGAMPPGNPAVLHYAMIGAGAALSALGTEFKMLTGVAADDPEVVEAQADAITRLFFPD